MSDHSHKNIILPLLVLALVAGGVGFYSGMKYGKSSAIPARGQFSGMMNGAPGGTRTGQGNRGQFAGGGATSGEVIAKDDKSITIKMRDGGSKIVFFSATTQVMKAISGAATDLSVGEQVTALGTANTDGSVSAQSIQIRPATPQVNAVAPAPTPTTPRVKTFTLADVAAHNTKASCYTTVGGSVYDLTPFIGQHPGGEANIMKICGVDGSSMFGDQHGGERRPVSELASLKIGTLAK